MNIKDYLNNPEIVKIIKLVEKQHNIINNILNLSYIENKSLLIIYNICSYDFYTLLIINIKNVKDFKLYFFDKNKKLKYYMNYKTNIASYYYLNNSYKICYDDKHITKYNKLIKFTIYKKINNTVYIKEYNLRLNSIKIYSKYFNYLLLNKLIYYKNLYIYIYSKYINNIILKRNKYIINIIYLILYIYI